MHDACSMALGVCLLTSSFRASICSLSRLYSRAFSFSRASSDGPTVTTAWRGDSLRREGRGGKGRGGEGRRTAVTGWEEATE